MNRPRPILKLLTIGLVKYWAADRRSAGRRLVVTNGCFDILHAGHVSMLQFARAQGNALLVGLNSDASVAALKPGRPINCEADRVAVLCALECVDYVCVFPGECWKFLDCVAPSIYVKSEDYTMETLDIREREVLEGCGAEIRFAPLLPGRSTTVILAKQTADNDTCLPCVGS